MDTFNCTNIATNIAICTTMAIAAMTMNAWTQPDIKLLALP
jgi:hypothetical protein